MFLVLITSVTLFFLFCNLITKTLKAKSYHLPPGSLGWPLIGETLNLIRASNDGEPWRFVRERMIQHDSRVFKTSLFGEPMIVFCGTAGHKFLFSNENKMVTVWWPSSVKKLLRSCLANAVGEEAKWMRKMLMTFLNPNALVRYIETMDSVTQKHIASHWEGKEEVKVYTTVGSYTFELACCLFASIDDPLHISELETQFNVFLQGVIVFPINLPGTKFYNAMRSVNVIRKELQLIVKRRREALEASTASPAQDLLSHLLVTPDASGRFLKEIEIIDNILLLLFAGHDTSRSAITLVMKYLGQMPQVFEKVMKEQIDIAKSKEAGELLKPEDIQKMKYSWHVVSEIMRLSPPVSGSFREALVDFTYAGYTIPKGWKLYWNAGSTQKDETLFPDPENFDASRFQEGGGPAPYSYVPFGGGPRMCPGNEYARLDILVFLHNIIKRYKWDLLIPDEKLAYKTMIVPVKGLPIRLRPNQFSSN